jgi:cytochrome P450
MTNTTEKPSVKGRKAPTPAEGLPFFGQVFEAWKDPLKLFMKSRAKYGRVVRLDFIWMRYLVVSSVEGAKHVLIDEHRKYRKSVNYDGLKFVLGQGLLTSEGDFWLKQRRLAQPAFHRDRISALAETMLEATDDTVASWLRTGRESPSIDIHSEMMQLTLRIVVRTLFGADVANAKEIGAAVSVAIRWADEFAGAAIRLPPHIPIPRNREFVKAKATLDALVQNIIDERRGKTDERHDLLSMYMEAEDADTGERMDDAQLRDEIMTLVVAGHETTANALAWAFYLLGQHPPAMRKLRAEIDTVLGDATPTPEKLRAMPTLTQTLDEVLRLYPPAWVVERQANEADVVAGYRVEKDTVVGVSPYLIHRDPDYWENPEGFDPERFSPERSANRPKLAYVPFGAGPRFCIGNNFALMEAQLIVARILQRVDLELVSGQHIDVDPVVTLRPSAPIKMRVTKKRLT